MKHFPWLTSVVSWEIKSDSWWCSALNPIKTIRRSEGGDTLDPPPTTNVYKSNRPYQNIRLLSTQRIYFSFRNAAASINRFGPPPVSSHYTALDLRNVPPPDIWRRWIILDLTHFLLFDNYLILDPSSSLSLQPDSKRISDFQSADRRGWDALWCNVSDGCRLGGGGKKRNQNVNQ